MLNIISTFLYIPFQIVHKDYLNTEIERIILNVFMIDIANDD
jgi:hypothetical protein